MDRITYRHWRESHFKLQEGRCFYCAGRMARKQNPRDRQGQNLCTLDHLTPVSRGGADTFENTAAACRTCNVRKGDMSVDEFRARLVKERAAPTAEGEREHG